MRNVFWPVYLNLEHELLDIARTIHIDDKQLDVYSMRICDLIVRTVIEVEALSKELFFSNGGSLPDEQQFPYFDTDCMKLLVDKWSIDKREVLVTSPVFDLQLDENKILHPLHKSHKRGTSGADWCQAYQKVKHDRAKEFKEGKLKYFVRALAALYVLNLYYRNESLPLEHDGTGSSHDFSLGSQIFSVRCHGKGSVVNADGTYAHGEDYDACVYLSIPDEQLYKQAVDVINQIESEATQLAVQALQEELNTQQDPVEYFNTKGQSRLNELRQKYQTQVSQQRGVSIGKIMYKMNYDGVLNKHQI